MMRSRTTFAAIIVLVAALAGIAGFAVARSLTPDSRPAEVSVLQLPASPTPTPDATPEPEVSNRVRVRTSNGDVDIDGRGRSCPAGCSCDQHPSGIVIRCTGN